MTHQEEVDDRPDAPTVDPPESDDMECDCCFFFIEEEDRTADDDDPGRG